MDTGIEPTDIQLMLAARGGDVMAFHRLAQRYREPLRRFFASLIADPSQADDFVQETLLRLWSCRDRYEPTGKFSTYLFQIGKHYWFNQRKKYHATTELQAADTLTIESIGQPEVTLLQQYRAEQIHQAVLDLPEIYRIVFKLSQYDDHSYAEIARHLNIPIGTVKYRMFEAVRRLRKTLVAADL